MVFDSFDQPNPGAKIKVIGVGGGGTNAVNTMIRNNIDGVEFISLNTDIQSLKFALASTKIQIGKELTKGLGAGADPDIGRDAALEDRHEIQKALADSDMVFITAGMGGGTGTGGAAIVAQIAREMGALTVGVVTKPFLFEGKRRRIHAEMGIERLKENVDTLIVIPNQRLLQIATPELSMIDAFKMADTVLVNAVRGISDIINIPGTINVDFADVKTVMSSMGQALMGIGRSSGPNRAVEAANQAISSPLLEDIDIEGASGILINITAGANVSLLEINEACTIIQDAAHEDANIIFGAVIDETMKDSIQVTVIATGFPNDKQEQSSAYHQNHNSHHVVSKPSFAPKSSYPSSSPSHNRHISSPYYRERSQFIAQNTAKPKEKVEERLPIPSPTTDSHHDIPSFIQENRSTPVLDFNEPSGSTQNHTQKSNFDSLHLDMKSSKIDRPIEDIETFGINEDVFAEPETCHDLSSEIDKKIDEALELAERIKYSENFDEIEIPTFLRNNNPGINIQ